MRKHDITTAPDPTGATTAAPSCSTSEQSKIERAAMWLSDQAEKPAQLIPHLKAEFQLSAVQACEAVAMARRSEINRRAFG
jgi:hypothetical protein